MRGILIFAFIFPASAAEGTGPGYGETFIWTRSEEGFESEDHALVGHVFKEIPDIRILTQCAYHCLQHDECESFNLNREVHKCALNKATDQQHPGDLQPTFDVDYVRKGTYLIEDVSTYSKIHCSDVMMSTMSSQITSLTLVYSTVYSGADQRKQQSSAPLAFVQGIHRSPVNFPHKRPVMRIYFSTLWRHNDSHLKLRIAMMQSLSLVAPQDQWWQNWHYDDTGFKWM